MKVSRLAPVATFVFAIAACCMISTDAFGQGRGGGGRGLGINSPLTSLFRGDVQKELGLVDDQVEELENLQGEMRDEMRSAFEEMRSGGGGDFQAMRERMNEMAGDFTEKAKELLLDDQVKRLDEIYFQQNFQRDPAGALKEKFDLSDEEMEEFAAAREAAQKEMGEELAKLREKYRNQALDVLPSDVQDEIKEAMGKAFIGDQQRGRGQRGGGQRGGGQRGGQQRGGGRPGGGDRPRSDF